MNVLSKAIEIGNKEFYINTLRHYLLFDRAEATAMWNFMTDSYDNSDLKQLRTLRDYKNTNTVITKTHPDGYDEVVGYDNKAWDKALDRLGLTIEQKIKLNKLISNEANKQQDTELAR